MMKQLVILVAIGSIFVGLSGAKPAGAPAHPSKLSAAEIRLPHKEPKFKLISTTCESGCLETYETKEGRQVTFTYACFVGSPEEVPAAIQTLIEDGRVLERRWRPINRSRRVERSVVLYPRSGLARSAAIFFYRPGKLCFLQIESDSLELTLEFERSARVRKALVKWE